MRKETNPKRKKRDEEAKTWELVVAASIQLWLCLRTSEVQKMGGIVRNITPRPSLAQSLARASNKNPFCTPNGIVGRSYARIHIFRLHADLRREKSEVVDVRQKMEGVRGGGSFCLESAVWAGGCGGWGGGISYGY